MATAPICLEQGNDAKWVRFA